MGNSIIAVGVAGGSPARRLAEKVDSHPFMELVGIAHEYSDLLRMAEKARPDVLLLPLTSARELTNRSVEELAPLIRLLCFIVWGEDEVDFEARVLLSLPLRWGGTIDPAWSTEEIYRFISSRLRLIMAHWQEKSGVSNWVRRDNSIHLFTGGKGGCGSTLLALVFSLALSRSGKRILLLEADPSNSQLGAFLEEKGGKSVPDLLPLADDLSWEMLSRGLYRHPGGFLILPFHATRGTVGQVRLAGADLSRWPHLLRNLSFLFDHIVMDCPPGAGGVHSVLPLLSNAFIVCTQEILSLHGARRTADDLRRLGVPMDRLNLILNRYSRRSLVEPHHVLQAVGLEIAALVPERPGEGRDFAELGKLPSEKSPIYKTLESLASNLTKKKNLADTLDLKAPDFPLPGGRTGARDLLKRSYPQASATRTAHPGGKPVLSRPPGFKREAQA